MDNLIKKMIEDATTVVDKHGDGQNHTVGSAVATKEGRVITGLNLHHFTGGPCGEVVALASAISSGEKNLVAVVAVADRGRGVLAPCGRCRQILFDYFPDILVVLPEADRYITKPVRAMLPDVYDWKAQQSAGTVESRSSSVQSREP